MKEKKKIVITVILLLSVICVTVGVTYAAFTFVKVGTVENTIETGTVMLTYTEGKTGIILEDALPISDETGKMLTGENNTFDFTVSATLGKDTVITYEVTAVKIPITDMEPLLDNEVKLYLERAIDPETAYTEIMAPTNFIPRVEVSEIGSPLGSMILDTGTFSNEGVTIHNYRLRMWVDENTEITDVQKKYGIKINVYAKQGVFVNEPTESSCFVFDETTGTITNYQEIDASGNECPKDVIIPRQIDGVDVVNIGKASSVSRVMGPFSSKGLTSVVIPDSVTTIGDYAFLNNQLTSVTIGKKVNNIGIVAFNNNQLLDEDAFIYQRNSDGSIDYTNLVSYGGARRDRVVIPDGVVNINEQAFFNLGLNEVIIPNSVTTIELGAFDKNNLTMLSLGNSIKNIGERAFRYNQLTSVTIPNSVTTIGEYAFSSNQLTSVTIGNSVTTIGGYAFSYNQLTSVTIPDSVTTIGDSAFRYNDLTSVEIPNSVTTIGDRALYKDSSSNPNLEKIINKTGREFEWQVITSYSSGTTFVTGVIPHSDGDIIVTDTE